MAILFTDIVGYSALTERDEAAAIRVRERHYTLVRTLARQFEGEVVDATGDEAFAIFPSALLAVDCALALQAALRDDRDLAIRIGIHLGDVTRRGAQAIGEGVNVAARIRPLAEPGGIAISESVYQAVRTRSHIRATSLGAQALKNVASPVNVFELAPVPSEPRRARWRVRLALAAAALLALAYGVWTQYRIEILTSVALAAPRYFGDPIEQTLGFATTSDGVRIAYATTGSGPPIVLVIGWSTHLQEGFMSPMYDVLGWIARTSERNTLVRYDGRGFGMSQRDVTDFSLESRVRDIEAVVEALHLERISLYGASAGGPAAIAYAVRHPERVSRLVLVATHPGTASVPESVTISGETETGMSELIRTSWDVPAVRDMFLLAAFPDVDELQRKVLSEFLRLSGDGPATAGFFAAAATEDASAMASSLEIPTLVIHGDRDVTVPVAYGVKLASLIPGVRFEILKGASHNGTMSDPRTLRLVAEFVEADGR
ncbi:MAG: alpha/beta fold hydrolase [Myxococcota bacterium]